MQLRRLLSFHGPHHIHLSPEAQAHKRRAGRASQPGVHISNRVWPVRHAAESSSVELLNFGRQLTILMTPDLAWRSGAVAFLSKLQDLFVESQDANFCEMVSSFPEADKSRDYSKCSEDIIRPSILDNVYTLSTQILRYPGRRQRGGRYRSLICFLLHLPSLLPPVASGKAYSE